jgi:hypothetical protein
MANCLSRHFQAGQRIKIDQFTTKAGKEPAVDGECVCVNLKTVVSSSLGRLKPQARKAARAEGVSETAVHNLQREQQGKQIFLFFFL